LYRPPVKSGTWLLWFGPFVLLIAAVAALLRYLHRRRARTDGAQVTAEEHRQAQALLAEDMRDEAP
jgi:cytochrome c-type biogenesis protein CcmH